MPAQATIRCVLMRGGTSKGLYFHESDLPPNGPVRDRLLERLMGSPDVLQIDGLGGARPITSKVAIVSRSLRDDADIDYTFAQVDIEKSGVVYLGNCGNISSGVGPFAIDEGLVAAVEGITRVRIYNTNTRKMMTADVPVEHGRAKVEGDFAIPGVPGTGAEIMMDWSGTIGSRSGRLLPTGHAVDRVDLEDGSSVDATLCDAANVCVWARAGDFGLSGVETVATIGDDHRFLARAREVRGKLAQRMGVLKDWTRVDQALPGFMIGIVSEPADFYAIDGTFVAAHTMDLTVRLIFMNTLHESIAGTGSISLAAASRIPNSVVANVVRSASKDVLRIGHPSGVTPAVTRTHETETPPYVGFDILGFSRTARRLMDCRAYYPATLHDG